LLPDAVTEMVARASWGMLATAAPTAKLSATDLPGRFLEHIFSLQFTARCESSPEAFSHQTRTFAGNATAQGTKQFIK
jgi:hypothetical protein